MKSITALSTLLILSSTLYGGEIVRPRADSTVSSVDQVIVRAPAGGWPVVLLRAKARDAKWTVQKTATPVRDGLFRAAVRYDAAGTGEYEVMVVTVSDQKTATQWKPGVVLNAVPESVTRSAPRQVRLRLNTATRFDAKPDSGVIRK